MQCLSITAAAESLHVSQPSVSRLIADLERSVGFPLFLRTGRGLSATAEAIRFYQSVEGMFIGVDRLKEAAHAIKTDDGGTVSLGVIQSIATLEVPKAIRLACERFDGLRFMVQSRNTPSILEALLSNQLDIGVVGRQPPYAGVETLFDTSAPYVCLLPEDHPLTETDGPLDLEDLADRESFITTGAAYPDEMTGIDTRLSKKLQANSRISATNMPVAAALVRETGSLAIADPFSAEQAVRMGGVVFRPIRQYLTYHIAIVCKARDLLPRQALEFTNILSGQITARIKMLDGYSDK